MSRLSIGITNVKKIAPWLFNEFYYQNNGNWNFFELDLFEMCPAQTGNPLLPVGALVLLSNPFEAIAYLLLCINSIKYNSISKLDYPSATPSASI